MISQVHIILTFYSYYFHIFITFLGSGPRSGPQKSYFCHIPGHILFILLDMPGLDPLSIPQSLKITPLLVWRLAAEAAAFKYPGAAVKLRRLNVRLIQKISTISSLPGTPSAHGRARPGPGPVPPLWGLGPGSGPQNVKII